MKIRFGKVSILTRHLPDPARSSGELRFWQTIEFLRDSSHSLQIFTPQRGKLPVHDGLTIRKMVELEECAVGSDFALLEFWYPGYCIPRLRRLGVPVVVDAVDVEFRRREQETSLIGNQGEYGHRERDKEIAAYRRADLVLTVSEQDDMEIRGIARRTTRLPNIYQPPHQQTRIEERHGVIFVGSYKHRPNSDGIRWYRDRILPLVRDLEHIFVGHDADADIRELPGFIGGVKSSADLVSQARVSIAPLRYGAGLKGKVLEAFACATPVVATPVAIEGYQGDQDYPATASDPAAFAELIRRLYEDDDYWRAVSNRCIQMAAPYQPHRVFSALATQLEALNP